MKMIPRFTGFLLRMYAGGILMSALLRLVFLIYNSPSEAIITSTLTWKCFQIGFVFDSVVQAYIAAIPILLFLILYLRKDASNLIRYTTVIWYSVLFPVAFFITVADIPYFRFFRNRLSDAALQWMGTPSIVLDMIVSNPANLMFLILAVAGLSVMSIVIFRFGKRFLIRSDWKSEYQNFPAGKSITVFLISGLICFAGMRGKMTHPIRPGDAFYCNDPLLNQAGLNPVYTLLKSFSYKVHLMDESLAISNTQSYLSITDPILKISPIARMIQSGKDVQSYNVVIVLMEGMSASFMGSFGNTLGLTPCLDSLASQSLFFTNAWSAGIHTNNGIFSTLYSLPALKRVRPMSDVPVHEFSGLPYELKTRGYRNAFFCAHNRAFDNIGNFIPANHFDEMHTQEDFPIEASVGPYGVPDEYLFQRAADCLDELSEKGPFMATILTASNHDPYILPPGFPDKFKNKELNAVHFADYSIGTFIKRVKAKSWYHNTIFVFVSDHGRVYGNNPYDLALSFNHIPIIIHAPCLKEAPRNITTLTGQVDVFPTVMHLLGGTYLNNTLGNDALLNKRPYMYFSQDDKIACIDDKWLYVYRFGGNESLYEYKAETLLTDHSQTEKNRLKRMRDYAFSQTQTAEHLIRSDQTPPMK